MHKWRKGIFFRFFICALFLGVCLYSYLDTQNQITELRIRIPELISSTRHLEEENTRLLYEIEKFESSENLLKLINQSEFAYLRYPMNREVLTLKQAPSFKEIEESYQAPCKNQVNITFATGGK